MDTLLLEFYDLMISRLKEMGASVPDASNNPALREFWNEIDQFMPPNGQLVLAKSGAGDLVGCGCLKRLDHDSGELKRLFVKPEARGLGVGRQLVQMRMDAARDIGLKKLYVDTLRNNVEMRGLYKKLGFQEIDGYPESSTIKRFPEFVPYMKYFSISL